MHTHNLVRRAGSTLWPTALALLVLLVLLSSTQLHAQYSFGNSPLYVMPEQGETRWATPENVRGEKGQGGRANLGAKGSPFTRIPPGETLTLLDTQGSGMITRMWMTLSEFAPAALRSLRLDMYWDGETEPAVSAPLGDFFGAVHGETKAMENAFFANPESRSFNCFLPMPYRKGARITITNESRMMVRLFTYEVNFLTGVVHPENMLYFHAHWRRERWTTLGEDFTIMPQVTGRGRYLGTYIGMLQKPGNKGWWGEGEVKIFVDGDEDYATLVGTGLEDYVGTGWGLKNFAERYQGGHINEDGSIAMYRFHVAEPVYFKDSCRVTLQQLGNIYKHMFPELMETAEVKPVVIVSWKKGFRYTNLLEDDPDRTLETPEEDEEGVIHYRRDDLSAVAFFYLDRPVNNLPPLAEVSVRTEALSDKTSFLPQPQGPDSLPETNENHEE